MSFANKLTSFLVGRLGLNFQGAMVLTVRGRKSGELRSVVVNPLNYTGNTYLMSPRGETQWVKNIRADNRLTLHRGSKRNNFQATEVTDQYFKFLVIGAYLERWDWQVRTIMKVSRESPDEDIHAVIEAHPVFMLEQE